MKAVSIVGLRVLFISLLSLAVSIFAHAGEDTPSLKNLKTHGETSFSGGQPSESDITWMAKHGVKHVINLRMPKEMADLNEISWVEQVGMSYSHLPIKGAAGLTRENVSKFNDLLLAKGEDQSLVHCASGNRVGALMALRAVWEQGKSKAEALAIGETWGMTRLRAEVERLLAEE